CLWTMVRPPERMARGERAHARALRARSSLLSRGWRPGLRTHPRRNVPAGDRVHLLRQERNPAWLAVYWPRAPAEPRLPSPPVAAMSDEFYPTSPRGERGILRSDAQAHYGTLKSG